MTVRENLIPARVGGFRGSVAAGLLLLVTSLAACSDGVTDPAGGTEDEDRGDGSAEPIQLIHRLPRDLTSTEVDLIGASNDFAFDLARQVSHPDSSFLISPLSASMALGMTMNGADGNTWEEMRTVLGFEGMTQEDINESYRTLTELLLTLDGSVTTGLANSVWIRSGFSVFDSFREVLEADFDAEVGVLDFDDPASVDVVNAWVSEATNGRIEDIVEPPIEPAAVMFLMNALFFQAPWSLPFDPANTEMAPFRLRDGTTVDVEMMGFERRQFFYATETEHYTAMDLPFGGRAYALTVVVPSELDGLAALVSGLDGAGWRTLTEGIRDAFVGVHLPRFTLEYEREYQDVLTELGMGEAFDPLRADFSRLSSREGLFVREVRQKTFLTVNEEGADAAAATLAVGAALSEIPRIDVRADRPFLFAIRERLSGTILFLGAVVEAPEE